MTGGGRIDAIAALFDGLDWNKEPGCAAMLLQGGRPAWTGRFGLANLERRTPVRASTRFRICSITKPMIAVMIAALEDEGRLALSDRLSSHVPELRVRTDPTLAQLLGMTSGLYESYSLAALSAGFGAAGNSLEASLALQLAQTGQSFAPGDRTLYCNANYLLLQLAAERATGEPCADLLDRLVFQPAGMSNAAMIEGPASRAVDAATAYAPEGAGFRYADPDVSSGAAGAVVATLGDMARFHAWLRQDPHGWLVRLAAPKVHSDGSESGYALGFGRQTMSGRLLLGHSGGIDGWLCDYIWSPRDDVAAIVLGARNDVNFIERTREMLTVWLGLDPDPAMTPGLASPSPPTTVWSATYASEADGFSCELAGSPTELVCEGRRMPLQSDGTCRRSLGVEPISFRPHGAMTSAPPAFERTEGAITVRLTRTDQTPPAPREGVEGVYASTDLPQPVRIARDEQGALQVCLGPPWPAAAPRRLIPVGGALFRARREDGAWEDLHVRVHPGDGGPAPAISVYMARLLDFRLERTDDHGDLAWFERARTAPRLLSERSR